MRFIFVFLTFFPLLISNVHAADPVGKAMKLYEKRHYAEAEKVLLADLPQIKQGRQGAALLALGMIYLRNAELHRELYRASLSANLDYLRKLATRRGRSRSRFADLYLGKALIEAGKLRSARTHLQKFVRNGAVDRRSKAAATVAIGLSYALQKNPAKAEQTWAGVDRSDPEIRASLVAAYSRAGLRKRESVKIANQIGEPKKPGRQAPIRHIANFLTIYANAGLFEKGLDLARRVDLKDFSYRESRSKSKVIHFYEISLLSDLSQLYLQAALDALGKAAKDGPLKESANYYIGEACSFSGDIDQSVKATGIFISASTMPAQLRDRAMARQAANQYRKGRKLDAIGKWNVLSQKKPQDPDLLAEILFECSRLGIDCPRVARESAAAVDAGDGKRFFNLNVAVGRYYMSKKDYAKAITYLEAGRDKGNKNKIESNDPVMLVNLADAYYRTKKFSEALEIYFEMSRQFPEVRQIQEAYQGIYAVEHKSAGDVKIN